MEVSELNLADGEYTVEVTMEGGSGRPPFSHPQNYWWRTDRRQRKLSGVVPIMTI